MGRDAAAVRIFPPAVPVLAILLAVGLDRVVPIHVGVELAAPARYWLGAAIAVAALLMLGLWSVVLMRRSGQTENPWSPTIRIVDRGPFSISRNPMYLQMVIVCIGVAIAMWSVWLLLLTPIVALALQRLAIRPEEAYLERKFGDGYLAYKRRVRRWL
jgi:protein-S-isoprenylcysteine O-methyltransferase Ste14